MDISDIFWIGLTDKKQGGTFAWESGHELSLEIAEHWRRYADGSSEPNSYTGEEDCVLVAGSKMYDSKCNRNKHEGIHKQYLVVLSWEVTLLTISGYIVVDEPRDACDYIKTSEECRAAAKYLKLPDTGIPKDGTNDNPQNDPPYCYFEDNDLKFNRDGSNKGKCGAAVDGLRKYKDYCLCKNGKKHQRLSVCM